jgi:hypothetical protein
VPTIEDRALFYMKARRDQLSVPSFRSEFWKELAPSWA